MSDNNCTVVIKNESLDQNTTHRYYSYFADQPVLGGELIKALQPIFFTRDIRLHHQTQFQVSPQLYAFIGKRERFVGDRSIKPYEKISLETTKKVEVGSRAGDGTSLLVSWDKTQGSPYFAENDNHDPIESGHFAIWCQASIPKGTKHVVGIARMIDDDRPRPVSVMPCVPRLRYTFKPNNKICVERCDSRTQHFKNSVIIIPALINDSRYRAKFPLQFDGDSEEIQVTEKPTGFYVNGKLARDEAEIVDDAEDPEEPHDIEGRAVPGRNTAPPPPAKAGVPDIVDTTPAMKKPSPPQEDELPKEPDGKDSARGTAAAAAEQSSDHNTFKETQAASEGDRRALVQYSYEKAEDNELELKEGEYITNIKMVDKGWWMGTNTQGESGLFPSNYVELVKDSGKTATAQYDYEATEDNELSFPEGAKITNLEFTDNDWWFGYYKGESGLFPCNYVELNN